MKKRVAYIDIAKAIGMILVILGHMDIPGNLYNYLFSFHMPLFIILSGFVFNQEKIWKQVKSLLITFLSLSVILSVVDIAVKLLVSHKAVDYLSYLKAILGGAAAPFYRFNPAPAIWFLTALMIVEIASFLLSFLGKYRIIPIIVMVIVGFLIAPYKESLYIPWNIDVALFLIPFFELARDLKKVLGKISSVRPWIMIPIGVAGLWVLMPLSQLNGTVNIFRCQYGNNIFLYYLNSLIGSSAIICLSIALSSLKHTALICWMGRNTVIPMATHQMLLPLVVFIMGYIPYYSHPIAVIAINAIGLIILTTISYLLAWVVDRFCPIILGKQKNKDKRNSKEC